MKINILHLYYDLMNLYGEVGNINAIVHSLKEEKIKVNVDNLTINDQIDFSKYDLIYIGCGTELNRNIVLKDILRYKSEIFKFIESNGFVIATGNSLELFLNSINDNKGLGIFDYNAKDIDKRIVGDLVLNVDFVKEEVLGFRNQGSNITDNITDGILNYKNFYGTYLLGPILVRNPILHEYIIKSLIKEKNKKFKFKKLDLSLDINAKEVYMSKYHSK